MTELPPGPSQEPETEVVIVIDLRSGAAGPDAADPGSVDGGTLEERQRRGYQAAADAAGDSSGWQLINFERLLVVDDAAAFAGHEDAYRHLIEAPTFGRMLCLVIGAPAEPPYLDQPKAADSARVPVLWVGDPRGVGWRIGKANTTRLAFSDTDPDGSVTVASLIESLATFEVFDEFARAVSGLPDRTGVPALLPWVPWPSPDQDLAEQDHRVWKAEPQDSGAGPAGLTLAADSLSGSGRRRASGLGAVLLALGCVAVLGAALVALWLRRLGASSGYLVADVGAAVVILLLLLAIAHRRRGSPVVVIEGAAVPTPAEPDRPLSATSPGQEVQDLAQRMLTAPVADEAFRQLSSPEQLVMLGGDPDLARLVRIAPASARQLIEDTVDGDSICWTTAGDQVGVIRLIPVKAGLIRQQGT